MRLVGLFKVVDIAPIPGQRLTGGMLFDITTDQRRFASARGAKGKDIVALAVDVDAKLDRLDGAILTNKVGHIGQLGCCGALKVGRVSTTVERCG